MWKITIVFSVEAVYDRSTLALFNLLSFILRFVLPVALAVQEPAKLAGIVKLVEDLDYMTLKDVLDGLQYARKKWNAK